MGSQRVRHDRSNLAGTLLFIIITITIIIITHYLLPLRFGAIFFNFSPSVSLSTDEDNECKDFKVLGLSKVICVNL